MRKIPEYLDSSDRPVVAADIFVREIPEEDAAPAHFNRMYSGNPGMNPTLSPLLAWIQPSGTRRVVPSPKLR
jgi:hypothetical protein